MFIGGLWVFFVDWKYTIETRDLKVSKRVFCILITSGTTGPIGYKYERNVHWIVLLCLVFLFDLKYIKINRRGQQGVFCFCMWSVYFSTNLLEVCFLYVPDTILFFSTPYIFFMAPVVSKILWGQSGANTQNYEKKSNFDITSLDSIWNFLPAFIK
jgi:hypothetical protein